MMQKGQFLEQKNDKNGSDFCLSYWEMFDIRLFSSGMDGVLNIIDGWLISKAKKKWIATVNPEFVMKATKDVSFRRILNKTDLNLIDGIGLIWAKELETKLSGVDSSFLKKLWLGIKIGGEIIKGKHREGLVTGVDLMGELVELAERRKYKVFFLGGFDDRAKKTMEYFKKFKVEMDYCPGEPEMKNEEVLDRINKFEPDILFVAYGMKKQEEWICKNMDKLKVGVVIGVGRSFDYYSGDLKRASEKWRKMGLEWLYSLIKEPKRIKRQLELPKFVWKVLKSN